MAFKKCAHDKINKFMDKHSEFENEVLYNHISFIIDAYKERSKPPIEIIDLFLKQHSYYYIQTSDLYIEYKDTTFRILHENDMIHIVLNFLSENREQYALDTHTKSVLQQKIQKKIKTKHLTECIPESNTLQMILSFFHPNLFEHKQCAKYFLTIVGDILMKKNHCIYFVPFFMKSFLQKLNKYISLYFHTMNIFQWFKFKYTDHDTSISRLLNMKPLNMSFFNLQPDFFVNMICVSIHYSCRYTSSEVYLNHLPSEFKHDILWIQNNTKEDMIQSFRDAYILEKKDCFMDEKDMLFLWKSYLNKEGKLNVFQKNQELYHLISPHIAYTQNKFINVYSLYLPYVETFKLFWDTYIYEDDDEYEWTELYDLYCASYKCKMNESVFKDLIDFYYPNRVYNDKYITQIGCKLWDKKKELEPYISKGDPEELYKIYCKEFKSHRKVSKQYFVKLCIA